MWPPAFSDDAVQASEGWPLVEMTLQSSRAPVALGERRLTNHSWSI